MANTYTLIASNTLSSSAASVTFSSIPGTYTDLVLKYSTRGNNPADPQLSIRISLNNSANLTSSRTRITGDGSSVSSGRASNQQFIVFDYTSNSTGSTTNTFSNGEIYIPSYTVSQNKPLSDFGVMENNNTLAFITATAGLWRETSAITSVKLEFTDTSYSFVSGSSFFLYGIKNS